MSRQFACTRCDSVDLINIAFLDDRLPAQPERQLCTQCQTGQWHGLFEKERYHPERDLVANRPSGLGLG